MIRNWSLVLLVQPSESELYCTVLLEPAIGFQRQLELSDNRARMRVHNMEQVSGPSFPMLNTIIDRKVI